LTQIGRSLIAAGSGDDEGSDRGSPLLVAAGALVMVVGALGAFFGALFKSEASWQRELLADAAAVQFTRNPAALASALKKTGGLPAGAELTTPKLDQVSHFLFAEPDGWISTHPDLPSRI